MKICWDNLEKLEYRPDRGEWQNKFGHFYIYKDKCKACYEPFLVRKSSKGLFCDRSCSKSAENNPKYWFDKKHSKETKKKMSILQKGKNNNMYGKHHSDKTKKKISEKTKKAMNTTEMKNKMSEVRRKGTNHPFYGKKRPEHSIKISGQNHPNWKGGISCEPYCDVWLDKDFKEAIKARDGYQCLNPVCSGKSKQLCIHHINYIKKDCSPFNLITVCKSCNTKANADRDWHESWYSGIIQKRYGVFLK